MKTKFILLTILFLALLCFKTEGSPKPEMAKASKAVEVHQEHHFFLKNENYFMYKTKKID